MTGVSLPAPHELLLSIEPSSDLQTAWAGCEDNLPDLVFKRGNMALKKYTDAHGNEHLLDDEVSLLGPNVNTVGTTAQDSMRDRQFQPIRSFHYQQSPAPKVKSGYGNPCDDPDYIAQFWPGNERV
jgi:hypothetical protein